MLLMTYFSAFIPMSDNSNQSVLPGYIHSQRAATVALNIEANIEHEIVKIIRIYLTRVLPLNTPSTKHPICNLEILKFSMPFIIFLKPTVQSTAAWHVEVDTMVTSTS